MMLVNLLPQSLVSKRRSAREWLARNYVPVADRPAEEQDIARARDRERYTDDRREQQLQSTRRHRYRKLGITVEDYDAMAAAQGNACACCGAIAPGGRRKYWCVDHDHKTGAIRGLICATCNAAIGFLGDGIEGARNALRYLENHYGVSNG